MVEHAISVSALRKEFVTKHNAPGLWGAVRGLVRPTTSRRVAVDDVTFDIRPGERVGFIGANGAGKSTTVKLLSGILTPTSGTVRVLGRDPHRERVANAKDIGAVFGQRTQLWWDLPLHDSLDLIRLMYDTATDRHAQLVAEYTATAGIGELLDKPIRTMSLGQKMRAELVATLVHEPRVLYLDEPTIGLDVVAKKSIRDLILRQHAENGTMVFLTSHDMEDLEQIVERIIVIDDGRLLFDGPMDTLKREFGRGRVLVVEASERYSRLYAAFVSMNVRSSLSFRVDFYVGLVSTVAQQGAQVLALLFVMRAIPDLAGWSLDEILLMFGLISIARAINHMFGDQLWRLGWLFVRTGDFDAFLLRPVKPLFHFVASRFCQDGIGFLLVGVVLTVKGAIGIGTWSVWGVLSCVLAVVGGALIFFGINLITASLSFWIVDTLPLMTSVFMTNQLAQNPLPIYGPFVSVVLTAVLPYGLISYYPARAFAGRGVTPLAFAAPLAGVGIIALGVVVWAAGLRRYTSTGS